MNSSIHSLLGNLLYAEHCLKMPFILSSKLNRACSSEHCHLHFPNDKNRMKAVLQRTKDYKGRTGVIGM